MTFLQTIITCVKSIAWGALALIAFQTIELIFDFSKLDGFLGVLILILFVYFIASILGWALIGLPVHLLILTICKEKYFLYPLSALVFLVILLFNMKLEAALVFGIAAFLQASVFGWYVRKNVRKKMLKFSNS